MSFFNNIFKQSNNIKTISEYPLVLEQVKKSANAMQEYRPGKPFTDLELSLSYLAYIYWVMEASLRQSKYNDNSFFDSPNVSAREKSIFVLSLIAGNPSISKLIQKENPLFNANLELEWARNSESHSKWSECTSRAIIINCRGLAYRHTGILPQLDLPDRITLKKAYIVAKKWLSNTLDETSAKLLMPMDPP